MHHSVGKSGQFVGGQLSAQVKGPTWRLTCWPLPVVAAPLATIGLLGTKKRFTRNR